MMVYYYMRNCTNIDKHVYNTYGPVKVRTVKSGQLGQDRRKHIDLDLEIVQQEPVGREAWYFTAEHVRWTSL